MLKKEFQFRGDHDARQRELERWWDMEEEEHGQDKRRRDVAPGKRGFADKRRKQSASPGKLAMTAGLSMEIYELRGHGRKSVADQSGQSGDGAPARVARAAAPASQGPQTAGTHETIAQAMGQLDQTLSALFGDQDATARLIREITGETIEPELARKTAMTVLSY